MNVFDYFFKETEHLEKDFVIGNKETISFKELYRNSLKVASYLNENVGVDKNILIIGQNTVFFITVYMGILKSGNVCVPLDFNIEQENLNFITKLTESNSIFCDKKVKAKLDLIDFKTIIDEVEFNKVLNNQNIIDFNKNFNYQRLAEIIFTSGSTGKPKGVMISHQNIISNTNSIIEYLELTTKEIILVVLPFYYCYGLSLLHTHLKVGGSIVINNTFMFLGTVINDLKTFKCTGFSGVPSHFQMLLKKSTSFKKTAFPDLKYVTQAGGKLHDVFIKEFVDTFPDINFNIMYGQTEATARLSYLSHRLVLSKLGSIGKAIPGVTIKIVNKNGFEVPIGEIGEIVAKGSNIMQGYYKDTDATKIVLKDGWLYTGDLAKMDKDCFIYIVAREKEIIKVGGKRVCPKEIEELILSVPDVIDCKIKGIYDDILGEALIATVVIDHFDNIELAKKNILQFCKEKLAFHKIPKKIEIVDRIIEKATGK
jgi:acyl-CoA synthetase (AMP-forming)/AMP-acid ligase II